MDRIIVLVALLLVSARMPDYLRWMPTACDSVGLFVDPAFPHTTTSILKTE